MGRDEDSDSRRRLGRDKNSSRGEERDRREAGSRRSSPGHDSRHRRHRRPQGRRRSRTPDPARRGSSSDGRRHRERSRDRGRRHRRTDDQEDLPCRTTAEDGPTGARAVPRRRQGPLPSQEASFAVVQGEEPDKTVVKEKVNYGNTGLLAAAANSVVSRADGASMVALKYHEPAEARKPSPRDQWRLYVFKGADVVDTIELSTRSCWLVGREAAVVDFVAEHPSVSKQHAVLQFRYTEKRNEFGDRVGRVRPYLIDLESANGTMLNHDRVPDSRYLELRDKDMVQFGQSTREYVIMLASRH